MSSDQDYNQEYYKIRETIIWPIILVLEKLISDNKIKKILEVGAGSGWLTNYFKNRGDDIVGTDSSPIACEKYHLQEAEVAKLPFRDNTFDLLISISLIEHLPTPETQAFLSEAKRVLKNGGWIFLVTPNLSALRRFLLGKKWMGHLDPTHQKLYHYSQIKKILKENKFSQINYYHPLTPSDRIFWPFFYFLKLSPSFLRCAVNYLFISTPLAFIRDSLMIKAKNFK